MNTLIDSYKRKFVYLRLSVTDRCNFRCIYCLPNGYKPSFNEEELSVAEIQRIVRAFAKCGVWKVRLTGGEPTIRRDIIDIVQAISEVQGIRQIALTTNGNRLKYLAKSLRQAGLNSINISLDSLNKDKFEQITGTKKFLEVMEGIDEVLSLGYNQVKINVVLLKGLNSDDLLHFLAWIKNKKISVRFIELMKTGHNEELFKSRHLSAGALQFELLKTGWKIKPRQDGDGPAVIYENEEYMGNVGIIAPYSSEFCKTCNRLRVTSRGDLRLCLFGEKDFSLRKYCQDDFSQEELIQKIQTLLYDKPISHFLHEGKFGNTWNLAKIGG